RQPGGPPTRARSWSLQSWQSNNPRYVPHGRSVVKIRTTRCDHDVEGRSGSLTLAASLPIPAPGAVSYHSHSDSHTCESRSDCHSVALKMIDTDESVSLDHCRS